MTVVDGVEPEPGKVSKARLQFDAYRWHAGKLAPKKYGDRISHDVKGGGINFQPQILISCSSAGDDEGYIDISAAPEADLNIFGAHWLPAWHRSTHVSASLRRRSRPDARSARSD